MDTPRPTIAIVDDDAPIVAFMEDLLSAEGYTTIAWRSGVGAYDLIRREQPELVIIDLWMEHHGAGWDVLHELRMDPRTKAIPVVICSADTQGLQARETVEHSLDYTVVEKPFDVDVLLQTVSTLIAPV